MTKRSIFFLIMLMLVALLAACGGATETTTPDTVPPTSAPALEENEEAAAASEAVDAAGATTTPEIEAYPPPQASATPALPEDAYPAGEAPEVQSEPTEAYPGEVSGGTRVFVIVPPESEVAYIVQEEFLSGAVDRLGVDLGLTDTIGSTSEVTGEVAVDLAQQRFDGTFVVNLPSLTSDQPRRDQAIREDWLQSNQFPEARFEITSVAGLPAEYEQGQEVTFQVTGDMTIREITNPVTFDLTAVLSGDTLSGTASGTLRMSDYGFEPPTISNLFVVDDAFTVQLDFVARAE